MHTCIVKYLCHAFKKLLLKKTNTDVKVCRYFSSIKSSFSSQSKNYEPCPNPTTT
jgi:hypothetical protein